MIYSFNQLEDFIHSSAIKKFVQDSSKGRVSDLWITPSYNTFYNTVMCRCNYCEMYWQFISSNYDSIPPVGFLNDLEKFCVTHQHIKYDVKHNYPTFPVGANPYGGMVQPGDSLSIDNIKQSNTLDYINQKHYEELKDFAEILSHAEDIIKDICIGKGMNVTQDTLRWIAKQSDFNVDLQAKVLIGGQYDVCALCTKCQERHLVDNIPEFVNQDLTNNVWFKIKEFCNIHRHDYTIQEPTGRKFKIMEL